MGEAPEWLELQLREALLRDGQGIVQSLLNDRSLLPDNVPLKPHEKRYRQRKIKVITLFGAIDLYRDYICHEKCHQGRAPLDEALGLTGRYSPAVAKLACRAASQCGSYQEAADGLAEFGSIQLDPRDISRLVQEISPALAPALVSLGPDCGQSAKPASPEFELVKKKSAQAKELPPIEVLYVSPDGTGTPMRKDALVGRKGKQADGGAKTREAKLGCVFTQTSVDEKGKPIRDPDSTSYVGTFGGCRELGVLLHQEAQRRGLGRAKKVVYLGDGAAWVWENARLTFPDRIEILDFYHAGEHISTLCRSVFAQDATLAASKLEKWLHAAKETSPAGLLKEASGLLAAHPEWTEERRSIVKVEIGYLTSHASRTKYGEYRAAGYFIGSGVIEAGCKTVIGKRMKQSGMFWGESGAENLLRLRCLCMGPHFEGTWVARRKIVADQNRKMFRWSESEKMAA